MAPATATKTERIPPLQPGDHLTTEEFERRYEAMPELKKAELIEGIVHMPSPVSNEDHGAPHFNLNGCWFFYRAWTPAVEGGDNSTLRLDLKNRPQPDGFLRILPSHGGQSKTSDDGYVVGAPELIGEIAASSASYDLHEKLEAYERNQVREYVVWRVFDQAIDWFILRDGGFARLRPSSAGWYQSEVFPGLWLDANALVQGDLANVLQVLQQGVASAEHGEFVKMLAKKITE
jgi:Uma2 family endonuclease